MGEGLLLVRTMLVVACLCAAGCRVHTYPLTRDRVDQDLPEGKGCKGGIPCDERKKTRTVQMVEIELFQPVKRASTTTKKGVPPVKQERVPDATLYGNRGYVTVPEAAVSPEIQETSLPQPDKYVVQRGDTLQSISKHFYGTTQKWVVLYDANKAVIRGPNKIYPGQTIIIPAIGSDTQR